MNLNLGDDMGKIYKKISFLIALLMLTGAGCGRIESNSEDEISASLSADTDKDEKYGNYLQECIEEEIVQSTDCSSVHVNVDMADSTLLSVKIDSTGYSFTNTENETIIQYIEKLVGYSDFEVVFIDETVGEQHAAFAEGYDAGYEDGYNAGAQAVDAAYCVVRFSGSFTATVEGMIPDYNALPGNTIAIVHYFQDYPFLLRFNEDMTDKLIEGTTYVFDFETFEVDVPNVENNIDLSDYMYSIHVTSFRPAEDGEIGLDCIMPTVEMIYK